MKISVYQNIGKEVSFIFCGSQLSLYGTIQKYENDIVTLHYKRCNGEWHSWEIHDSWIQKVKPLTNKVKQYIDQYISNNKTA